MDPTIITMLIGFLALAAGQIRSTTALNKRFDDMNKETNGRFDAVMREMADLRERMARLEGSLDGFLAGRRDRDAT